MIGQSRIPVAVRLDRLPMGAFQRRSAALVAGGLFFESFDIFLAGSVIGALTSEGWSTPSLSATFISVTFFGLLVGAALAGFLGDRYGRVFTYRFNLLVLALTSLAGAFSPNMTVLIVLRGCMGLGIGAEAMVGYSLMAEFLPPHVRGRWEMLLNAAGSSASLVAALAGFLIIPHLGWRPMFVIVTVGALIVWVLRRALPESPRWLESRGRFSEADEVMARIEEESRASGGASSTRGQSAPADHAPESATAAEFADLFRPGQLRRTLIAWMMMISTLSIQYAVVTWLPTFFLKEGFDLSHSLLYTLISLVGAPLGPVIGMLLVDRLGRKWFAVVALVVTGCLSYVYASLSTQWAILGVGFLVILGIYLITAFAFALYASEMFPTALRFRGAGSTNAIGRLGTILSPYGVALLFTRSGSQSVFVSIAALCCLVAILLGLFGIETKRRSLEEIHA